MSPGIIGPQAWSPEGAAKAVSPFQGLILGNHRFPGLTPWAVLSRPLRGLIP